MFNKVLVLAGIALTMALPAQQTIENADKPLAKNAGRTGQLKQLLRIEEKTPQFYFHYPRKLRVADNGAIFVAGEEQLLQFAPTGEFVRNLYKKGKGVGEINSNFDFAIDRDAVYMFDVYGNKILVFDYAGKFLKELRLKLKLRYQDLLGVCGSQLVFVKKVWPKDRSQSRLCDIENKICALDPGSKKETLIDSFQTKSFLIALAKGGGGIPWENMLALLTSQGKLYVSASAEYRIVVVNALTKARECQFSRAYKRVPYVLPDFLEKTVQDHKPPEKKFSQDVTNLFAYKQSIWVQTSTESKEAGILIDAFSENGQFVDSFFIKRQGTLLHVQGEYLYVAESTPSGHIALVKYALVE